MSPASLPRTSQGRGRSRTSCRRWASSARQAYKNVAARTFVGDVQALLSGDVRRALVVLSEMLWGERQPGVSAEDWAEYQRLCRPESPDFILALPDYYAFFTYTLFRGRVPG